MGRDFVGRADNHFDNLYISEVRLRRRKPLEMGNRQNVCIKFKFEIEIEIRLRRRKPFEMGNRTNV